MTENSHYAEARALLVYADEVEEPDLRRDALAAAQVHATLATVQRGMSVGTLSVDLAPADSSGYLSIPWPPSDELVERVARVLYERYSPNRVAGFDDVDDGPWIATARAVLDVIGGEA